MTQAQVEELVSLVRQAVMSSTPFCSCWEFNTYETSVDPEALHQRLRELAGLTEQEWADSPTR